MLLDSSLDSRWGSTNNLIDLLAVLEENESWHGANTELSSNVGESVDVELVEANIGVLVGVLCDLGSDHLARAAPFGEAVDDDEVLGAGASGAGSAGDDLLELVVAGERKKVLVGDDLVVVVVVEGRRGCQKKLRGWMAQ